MAGENKEKRKVIQRATEIPKNFRADNEVKYAQTMGNKPHTTNSFAKDIYDFYQNNEV